MRPYLAFALAFLASLALPACNGGDSSPQGAGGPAAASGADAVKPLGGKELGKSSQLVGTWLAQTEGDYLGFEFLKDGKVLATHAMQAALLGEGSGTMLSYSVLDGGRLSLTAPNGQTQVFGVTISGDQLELKGTMLLSDGDTQRFRKLAAGQTLERALEEQRKAEAKVAQERYEAVLAYIQQPGLVITCKTPGPGAPVSVAIAPPDASGQQRAWHDDQPPHLDQIHLAVSGGEKPAASVTFGQQIQPPPTQPSYNSSTIPFEITGDPKKPKAVAQVTLGGRPFELELRRDAKLYGEIVARFDAEIARVEALRKPLLAALKDFAVLEGDSHSEHPARPKPNTARIVLVRDEASGSYAGESVLIDGTSGQAAPMPGTVARVTVVDDRPMLFVDCYNRQYQLTMDGTSGKLTGGWFYQGNPDGYGAELRIVEAMDAAARKKKHDAERKVLASLSPSTPVLGLLNTGVQFMPQPSPVALALSAAADGQVSGTASFPQVLAVVDVQGRITDTLAGPRLELQGGALRESGSQHASNLAMGLRNQRWVYRVAGADASAGRGDSIVLTDGARTLVQSTDAYKAELRKQLSDALAAGLTMATRHPDYGPTVPKQVFQFQLDPATRQVSGKCLSGAKPFHTQSTLQGELKEIFGLPQLVVQIADPPPAKQGAFHRTYTAHIAACPTAEGWYFSAPYWPDTNERSRDYFDMVEVRK